MIDVPIISSGNAGLTTTLGAKEAGASALATRKTYSTNTQTSMAQVDMNTVAQHQMGGRSGI